MAGESDHPPLVVIVGETASGKSALAIQIAQKYNGELICADSRTIYKGMDIGTAKPTKEEQGAVPHHILDVVKPDDKFTAADFKKLATQKINDIAKRGKLPILVGGTGLYIDAVIYDYQFAGQPSEAERKKLEEKSLAELQAMAAEKGCLGAEVEKNKRHLVRMLEQESPPPRDRDSLRSNTLVVGLQIPRSKLRQRIETRVEQMFRKGLRKEVERLRDKYGWEHEALTGIGYREFKPYYLGQESMGQVKRRISQNSLQLAKRQRTWFKRNPAIQWVDNPQAAEECIGAFLGR